GQTDKEAGTQTGSPTNAQLLQELEQMRLRIQQLEAQVKAQSTPAQTPAANVPTENLISGASPATANTNQQASSTPEKPQPFAFADWTWLNGNARTKTPAFDSKFFTPEIRFDTAYIYDFNQPKDDTISGSAEVFRAQEFQLTQMGVGGDFHYDNVRG